MNIHDFEVASAKVMGLAKTKSVQDIMKYTECSRIQVLRILDSIRKGLIEQIKILDDDKKRSCERFYQ